MSRPTLADVAREASVAVSTASIVLSESAQIDEIARKTQERIREAARRLKYRPNAGARLIQTRRPWAVALIQSAVMERASLSNKLLYGISMELQRHNLALSFMQLDDASLMEREPRFLRQREVDGVLVNYNVDMPKRLADFISHYEVPVVFLNTRGARNAVYFDQRAAVRQKVEALASMGHRRILLLNFTGSYGHYSVHDSIKGYLETMKKLDLKAWVEETQVPRPERLKASRKLLSTKGAPTAIVTLASSSALPVIQAAGLLGIDIPGELSICTFGSHEETSLIAPQPGYFSLPWEKAGRIAVQMLLSRIDDSFARPPSGCVPCEWNEGCGTLGPIPGKRLQK